MPNDLEDSSIKPVPDIDADLLERLLRGEVVIFVGNGVSRLGGVPSWDDLASSFWKDCFDQGLVNFTTYNRLKNELKDPLELLSICSEKLGSDDLAENLKEKLSVVDKNREKLNKIYGYIRDFQAGYVTTNYDSGLEDAQLTQDDLSQDEETLREKFKEISKRLTRVDLNDSFKDHKNKIAYLHGSASLPTERGIENKIILTLPDYIRHYREKQPGNGKSFLESLFKKTCLFIGYGLKEQEILQHLVIPGEAGTHYLLQGMFGYEQCILKEYERFYKSIHIKLIPYNLSEKGYAQLEDVLESWSRTFRQAKIDYYKQRIQRDEDEKNLCLIQEQNNEAFEMNPLNSKELELASILLSNQQALRNFFQYSNNPRFLKFLLGKNSEQRNIFLQGIPIEEAEHGEFLFPMAYLVRIAERLHAEKATINNDIYIEYVNYIHQALLSIIQGYSRQPHQDYSVIITQTIQILLLIGIEHIDEPIQRFLISSINNGWLENISWQLKDLLSALITAKHPFALDLFMVVIDHLPEESSSQSNIYYSLETIFQDTTILGVLSSFCGKDFIINLSKKLTEILWKEDNSVSDENFIMTLVENAAVKVENSALGLNFNLPYVPISQKRKNLIPILEQQLSSLEEKNKSRIIEKILHYYTYIWQDYGYIFYNDLYKNIDIASHFDRKCFLIYLLKEILSYTLQQQGEEKFQNIYQEITSDSKFFIFKRILLYCYGKNFSIVREKIFQLLSEEKSILFSEPFEAEIYHFFENNLSSFSEDEKTLIKKLIDEGPYKDLACLPEEAQKHYQQEVFKNYWKQKQFVSLVKDPEFAKDYQKLKEQTGEKEFFNFKDGFSFGTIQYIPLLKDDEALHLIINNTPAYLEKIRKFEPLGVRRRQSSLDEKPSNEGNIKQLQRLAKDHPIEIATRISYLRALRPIYIVQILEGLKESAQVEILDWSALLAFISSYLENIPAAPSESLETHFFEIKKGEEAKQIVRAFAEALPDNFQKTTIGANQVAEALIKLLSSLLDTYSFQHAAFNIEGDKKRPVSYLDSAINTCFGRALEKLLRIIVLNPECANQKFQDFYTKCLNKKVVEAYVFLGFYFTHLEKHLPEWSDQQANSLLAPDQEDAWRIFFEGFLKRRIKCLPQYESMFDHYEKAIKMGNNEYQDLLAEEFTGLFLYGKDTLDNNSLISICYQNKSFSLINRIIHCISCDIKRILHQQDKLTEEQEKEKQNLLEKAKQLWDFIWHKITDPPVQDTPISLLSALGGLIPGLHSLEENEYQQILQVLKHYPPKIRPWDFLIPNLLFLVKKDLNKYSACRLGKIYLEIIKKIDFPFPKDTHAEVIHLLEQFCSNADVKTVYDEIKGEYISKHWLDDFFHFFQ